jgi:hypothetical protein
MRFEADPDFDGEVGGDVAALAQEAVEAASTAYTEDAHVDVEERLRTELRERGVAAVDAASVAELAHGIRSGHHVSVL